MVLDCVYSNKPCQESVEVLQSQTQDYGKCFSFIPGKPVTNSGPSYGLRFTFNIEVYDTLGLVTSNSGLKVYVTQQGQYDWNGDVYIDKSSEINLAPGFEYSISVKPNRVEKLPAPFSECQNYRERKLAKFNSKQDCQTYCADK